MNITQHNTAVERIDGRAEADRDAAMLDVLGLQLPVQVDRGKWLVALFVGLLLARGNQTETTLRFTS